MPFLESVALALNTIRVQKLKSFFTLLGVMIGVMFLIAVVSIVQGMSNYVENDFAAKIIGVNTFTFRRQSDPESEHNPTISGASSSAARVSGRPTPSSCARSSRSETSRRSSTRLFCMR